MMGRASPGIEALRRYHLVRVDNVTEEHRGAARPAALIVSQHAAEGVVAVYEAAAVAVGGRGERAGRRESGSGEEDPEVTQR